MKDLSIDVLKNNISKLSQSLNGLNIDSVYLEKNNVIDKIFYKKEELHEVRSMSKLLVSMAVGIAIEDKLMIKGIPLSLDTKIYSQIENIVNIENRNNLSKIKEWTIRNLLTHTTGYESQMMSERFIQDINDDKLLDYALNYDIPYEVGTRFAYNNVEPFIISVFFQESFNINLKDYIYDKILKKLDIEEFEWKNYGKYCPGATGLYLKHTDFHKIGQLLLNDGKYKNEQIIPEYWVKEMCSLQMETPTAYKADRVLPKIGVGYYTFISRDGFVFRDGANGQYIILNKEKNVLITIMSTEKDMKSVTEILRDVI